MYIQMLQSYYIVYAIVQLYRIAVTKLIDSENAKLIFFARFVLNVGQDVHIIFGSFHVCSY